MKDQNFENQKIFLDKRGIAEYLGGVSCRTIDQWRQDHQMPCRKIGAVIRFSVAEVDLWYDNFRVGKTNSGKRESEK